MGATVRPSEDATRRRQGNRMRRVARRRRGERGRISNPGEIGSLCSARRGRSMLGNSRRGSGGFCRARASLRGSGKNRREIGVGGRQNCSDAGTAIDGSNGGRYTSDAFPRRSRNVVNPNTWSVHTKIANVVPTTPGVRLPQV